MYHCGHPLRAESERKMATVFEATPLFSVCTLFPHHRNELLYCTVTKARVPVDRRPSIHPILSDHLDVRTSEPTRSVKSTQEKDRPKVNRSKELLASTERR